MKIAIVMIALMTPCLAGAQASSDPKDGLKALVQQQMSMRKAIAEAYLRWIDATKKKDVDAVVSLYTDDAVVLPDDSNMVKGKDAIRDFYKRWYSGKDKLIKQEFTDTGTVMSDPGMVIETADFSGVVEIDGKEVSFRGKNLIVWKREMDGPWKIFRDIWNGSPAN